jgi:hypothetical protein
MWIIKEGILHLIQPWQWNIRSVRMIPFSLAVTPQEFTWDLRELYASWFTSFGEIKVGKQIHSWSSVDDNSPIDNINAYDYYLHLQFWAATGKYSSLGLTLDYYLNNTKLGFYYSPLHHTNRLPSQ